MQLYTKLDFKNYYRLDLHAYVPTDYPHRFEQGNGAILVDPNVPSVFATQRYPHRRVACSEQMHAGNRVILVCFRLARFALGSKSCLRPS